MPTYEIFTNHDMKVVKTITGSWSEVQDFVSKHRGVSARKLSAASVSAQVPAEAPVKKEVSASTKITAVYTDCWTSGNPGEGGYRVVNKNGEVLVERNWGSDQPHTNNWYELAGIGAGVKYLAEGGVLYTDSQICMGWLSRGLSRDLMSGKPEYATQLVKIIEAIKGMPQFKKIEIRFIDGGSNPADYGRRKH